MPLTVLSYALLASIIHSFVWLAFWLREDAVHPEPRWLIAITFLAGAIAVILAIISEKYAADLITNQTYQYIAWAAIEEIIKILAVAFFSLNSIYNDEPIDAMIYCITVALGFAAVENTLFILAPLMQGELAQSITTGSMRFIGATLVHTVSSALIGFALGYTFYRGAITKLLTVSLGIIGAIALHASFNLSIINARPDDALKTFMWIWTAVVILIILFEEIKAVKPQRTSANL